MTATETVVKPVAVSASAWKKSLLFGTGLGIAIGRDDLRVAIVKVRPGGAKVVKSLLVKEFRTRPATAWGAEITEFLTSVGESALAATVVLPRSEMIVRTLPLAGVPEKEISNALGLQMDTLHPYGDEEIAWAHARLSGGAVLAGLTRKEVLDGYETLFAEAGIPVAAVTFSAAVLYPAARLWNAGAPHVLTYFADETAPGEPPRVEVYGESEARPAYSAEFPLSSERALAVARKELRLAPETPGMAALEVLPGVRESILTADALAVAAAICGAVPGSSRVANLLPLERRASHGRLQVIVPTVLAILLAVAAVVVYGVLPTLEQRKFAEQIAVEMRKLEPAVKRAQQLESAAAADRARVKSLDEYRGRAQADLDVLNELTKLLAPPVWTNTLEIYPDSVVMAGEADQAASLLKILDASPLFQNSEFGLSVMRNGTTEQFRIKTMRRGRLGRTTP